MIKFLHSDPHLSHIYCMTFGIHCLILYYVGYDIPISLLVLFICMSIKFLWHLGLGGWVGYILQMLRSGKLKVCVTLQPLFRNVF